VAVNVYAAAHRLGKLLSFDYQYPAKLMRLSFAFYPEVQVIALIMIATKLCYPFDNIPRLPETFDDPATIKLDWSKWQEIVRDPAVEGFSKGEQAKVEDKDVLSMSEKKLDEYLDWYQRTWIDDRDPKISQQLLDLFPLEDLPQEVDTASTPKGQQVEEDRLKRMVQSLSWQKPRRRDKSGEPIANRPGSDYPRYRSVEELPEAAKLLFAKAAKSAGLTSDMMVRAVYSIERALFDWIMNERRQKFQREQELRPDMEAPDESDDELMSDDEMVERLGLV
jgi:RNA polymerase I-specific transcription initiation factor RRN7